MKFSFIRIFENRILSAIILTIISLLIVTALSVCYPFDRILASGNLGIRNMLFSFADPFMPSPKHPSIAIVAIDNATLSDSGWLGRWQDFKREYYAKVIDRLKKDGAIVIGIDVLFSEKSDEVSDKMLEKSIQEAGNVVLWFSKNEKIFPLEIFSKNATIGYFDPIIHPLNSVVYSIAPLSKISGEFRESFSFAVLRKYVSILYWTSQELTQTGYKYSEGYDFSKNPEFFIPFSEEGKNEMYIRYLPRGTDFPTISFKDVYFAETKGVNGEYNPETVRDKIVIIGSSATALHDEFFTPLGISDGVMIHANTINTVLRKHFITLFSSNIEIVLIFALSLFFSLFLLHVGNRGYQAVVAAIALIITGSFYLFLFLFFSKVSLHAIELSLSVFLVTISATTYKYIWEEKGKRLLKNALSQYLAEDLVGSVLANYDGIKLGGSRREVTLFFSDIAGFTTISEGMEPETLVHFLSIYLKKVSDIIIAQKGFINKYEGDAVMAIWWAFGEELWQAYYACLAALEQQEKIHELNTELKDTFGVEISVRMGINKGPAVVGNIGSAGKKIEFTALGDTVNTASRLEGINKMYGTLICVGESVKIQVEQYFVFRKLDSLMVVGKEVPTVIYELIGKKENVSETTLAKIASFEKSLALYFDKQFTQAKEGFEMLAALGDRPSKTFLERIWLLEKNGIPENWNPNYRATEK